jgi:hypothetical protein
MPHFNGTAKDYAVKHGKATPGRGRPSREAMDFIAKAVAEGWTFNGKRPVVAVKGETHTDVKVSKDRPVARDDSQNYSPAFYRFPEGTEFVYEHEGKTYPCSERTACMNCGYSFVGHTCDTMVGLTKHGKKTVTVKGR